VSIRSSRSGTRLLAAVVLAVCGLQLPAAALAAPTQLLPDLRMELPTNLTLERSSGHYWLRFSAMIANLGDGPLEVRSTRRCADCTHMRVDQAIKLSDGTWAIRRTKTRQRFDPSDGHNHWHVMGMERYELFPLDAPFANGPLTGHKRGFCFFDGYRRDPGLPNYSPDPTYSYFGCGTPDSQSLLVGLSVGWGDLYPYDFAGQYVDLAAVPPGDYLVCLTADPTNWFRETRDGNNASWAKIHIPDASTLQDNHRTPITAIASSQRSCARQLPYTPAGKAAARRAARGGAAANGAPRWRAAALRGDAPLATPASVAAQPVTLSGDPANMVWVPGADVPASAGFYDKASPNTGCWIPGSGVGTS
jgi:hypothetical protein